MAASRDPWEPLELGALAALFAEAPFRWWVAGGLAVELAIGGHLRNHGDTDVLVLHRDHGAVRRYLAAWDCWQADPPGQLRSWSADEALASHVHDVWCRREGDSCWRFQLMFDHADGNDWVSRRDHRVRAPLEAITCRSTEHVPYLAPHVQLYYKAKAPRPKDLVDLEALLASDAAPLDRRWLSDALELSYGPHHPWLERLA